MKKKSRKALVKEADRVFSLWIRNRDSKNGIGACVTCGTLKNVSEAQNGHFQSRRHYSTRWDEKNCAFQCLGCNMFKQGEQYLFGKAIDQRWGAGTADSLIIKAKQSVKLSTQDLEGIIDLYKVKT